MWRHSIFQKKLTWFINKPHNSIINNLEYTHNDLCCVRIQLKDFNSEILFWPNLYTRSHIHTQTQKFSILWNSLTHDNKWEVIYILRIIFRYCLFQALLTSKLIYLRPLITSRIFHEEKKNESIFLIQTIYTQTEAKCEDTRGCHERHSSMFSKLISFPFSSFSISLILSLSREHVYATPGENYAYRRWR